DPATGFHQIFDARVVARTAQEHDDLFLVRNRMGGSDGASRESIRTESLRIAPVPDQDPTKPFLQEGVRYGELVRETREAFRERDRGRPPASRGRAHRIEHLPAETDWRGPRSEEHTTEL